MNRVDAPREFQVAPMDLRKVALLPAIALVAALTGVVVATRERPGVWWLLPVLILLSVVVARGLQRRRVTLDGGALHIHAGLHTLRIPMTELDASKAKIVDLDEHTELRPVLKTFGTALPGYRVGHFRLRDRSRAFVLLTGSRRVLVLEARSGRRVLLSLTTPRALLDALQNQT